MRKIAVMLNTLDPFFFLSNVTPDCVFPVQEGSALAALGVRMLGKQAVLLYHASKPTPDLDEALQTTDLGFCMLSSGVTHVVMPHRVSEAVHAWAHENSVVIVAPPFELQRDLEHKIRFNNELQQHGIPIPRTLRIEEITRERGPIVAQESVSFGLYGTRFFPDGQSFLNDPMSKDEDLLVRAYEEGVPVGISMLIDKDGNYCISALRRQCFIYKNGFPAIFTGIQWMPYSFFKVTTIQAIEKVMNSLRTMLVNKQFRGLANFDLLLSKNDCKVLECNPRLSSATAHIFGRYGLMPIHDPWRFFVNACTGKKNTQIHDIKVPNSEYAGALLDIDVEGTAELRGIPDVGKYEGYSLFHELFPGTDTLSDDTFCTIIADQALFDLRTGDFSKEGKKLYSTMRNKYIISDLHQ